MGRSSDSCQIVGSLETVNGAFNVAVVASQKSMQFIRNNDEQPKAQAGIDHFRNPRLVDLWVGDLDLGFAASRGNANTETSTLARNAQPATRRAKIAVHYTSIFSSSDFGCGASETTASSKRCGVGHNLNLKKKAFGFGAVDLESDRNGVIAQAGDREVFSTRLNRTAAELLLGDDFVHKFSASTHIEQKLDFFTNLSDTGAYCVNFDISAVRTSFGK
jgi:hypothetical protein